MALDTKAIRAEAARLTSVDRMGRGQALDFETLTLLRHFVATVVPQLCDALETAIVNPPPEARNDATIFECRCCPRCVTGRTDGSFDEPGWGRIEGIDGPNAICPDCLKDPTALDDFREEYPECRIASEVRP